MYSIVVEECAKSILAQMENASDLELFALQEVISEYSKINILLHRENARKEIKTYLKIRQEICRILLRR
jgi:hypothetical protein